MYRKLPWRDPSHCHFIQLYRTVLTPWPDHGGPIWHWSMLNATVVLYGLSLTLLLSNPFSYFFLTLQKSPTSLGCFARPCCLQHKLNNLSILSQFSFNHESYINIFTNSFFEILLISKYLIWIKDTNIVWYEWPTPESLNYNVKMRERFL